MKQKINQVMLDVYVRVQHDKRVKMAMGLGGLAMVMIPGSAHAALPFENTLCQVAQSMSGPIAKSVAVIAIVVTGLMIALTEISGVFKTLLGLLFGLSFALLANQWLGIFGSSGSTCVGS